MIKCTDNGIYTCIAKNGKPKNRYDSSDDVIREAKRLNKKYFSETTKLVGYKCSHCFHYHLTTVKKK
jgi:hypothetical protein